MSFFKTKSEALYYASSGIALASIPFVNLDVAMMGGMANDADNMDEFERGLQALVVFSALYYIPALVLLAPALTYLLVYSLCDMATNLFSCSTPTTPSP